MNIELSKPQFEFSTSQSKETFFIGGIGSGKTFVLAARALPVLCQEGSVCGIFAPTVKVLKNSTLRAFTENWEKMGFYHGLHYVVGQRPPAKWGVKPFSVKDNSGILTTIYGAYAILDGLDNFNSQRGTQFDEVFIDEFRDIKEEARTVLLGRLRGEKYKNEGKQQRIWYATTPPDNPYFLQKLASESNENINFIFGTSFDNKKNLPENYIETQASLLDTETYEREVLGRFIFANGKRFAYCFDKSKHIGETTITNRLPLYLSFDFNVDPATCIIGQHDDYGIRIHNEIRLKNASIYDICDHIRINYPNFNYVVTGDASGRAREKATRDLSSMYDIIARELGVGRGAMQQGNNNPGHHSNRTLVNSMLTNYQITINPQCNYLIQDLDMVQCADDGTIDKSNKDLTHLLDCFRYYLHTWFSWYLS